VLPNEGVVDHRLAQTGMTWTKAATTKDVLPGARMAGEPAPSALFSCAEGGSIDDTFGPALDARASTLAGPVI